MHRLTVRNSKVHFVAILSGKAKMAHFKKRLHVLPLPHFYGNDYRAEPLHG